eukprot:CAMPEP_0197034710 /NCGR_PEP_ID=MMETSP1384-20130603/12726_1 /TAXON_ID=29189 /ORGANISM="Ammonia sp." /LENGTH=453 /DNA_ID=CAMNT_0042464665 /DNA_START=35 /DNA_END=1396 /DNA_ORIENTATION=-
MATLTAEETELYDRQIRAWGFDAQRRMRQSKILVVGLDGAGSETLKNLVLAGLGNITILENKKVNDVLIETHFYLQSEHLHQLMADVAFTYFSEMNPMIKLSKDTSDPYEKSDDFYQSFDVVIVNNFSRFLQLRLDRICNAHNIGFFSSRSLGSYGYIFTDLQRHEYQIELMVKTVNKTLDEEDEKVSKIETATWYSLRSALSVSNKALKKQLRKKENLMAFVYSLQICEQMEDEILAKNKYFVGAQKAAKKSRDAQMTEIMKGVRDAKSSYFQVFKNTELKVKSSKQFDEKTMKDENNVLNQLLSVWNLSVCPSNAMLGGYLANFVMFYVQKKQKPLHNFLLFDMWNCEALEVLMRSESDEKQEKEQTQQQQENDNKKSNAMEIDDDEDDDVVQSAAASKNESVDISKLSVKKSDDVVELDDSEDDDIDTQQNKKENTNNAAPNDDVIVLSD